jgi:CubicO group peptidase (beta-lactamase class C family)
MERLQKLLDSLASQKPHHQAIMTVESGDGSFRWSGAAGKAVGGEPLSSETPFFIASIDKLYNTVIVLMLAEQGRLSLDDPVSAYLSATLTRRLVQPHSMVYNSIIEVND